VAPAAGFSSLIGDRSLNLGAVFGDYDLNLYLGRAADRQAFLGDVFVFELNAADHLTGARPPIEGVVPRPEPRTETHVLAHIGV
jgi:hypothetical protein